MKQDNSVQLASAILENKHEDFKASINKLSLHLAAAYDADAISLLVKNGADINSKHEGKTALHTAVLNNNKAAVQKLIELGSNLNEINDQGQTALHLAVYHQQRYPEIGNQEIPSHSFTSSPSLIPY
jgi:ankyrin repeat protein